MCFDIVHINKTISMCKQCVDGCMGMDLWLYVWAFVEECCLLFVILKLCLVHMPVL